MMEGGGEHPVSRLSSSRLAAPLLAMLAFLLLAAVTTIVSTPHNAPRVNWSKTRTLPQIGERSSDMAPRILNTTRGYYVSTSERNDAVVPSPARCEPELRTVSLRTSDDPALKYTPSCTRVERCGGCCIQEDFLSCQPTKREYLKFKVTVDRGSRYDRMKEIVIVERHTECKCACIKNQSHCNALQVYRKEECKCVCTNHDEKQKCLDDNPNLKFWDSEDCTCQCRDVKECTTGYAYNKHTCSCEPEQRQRIKGGYLSDSRGTYRRQP